MVYIDISAHFLLEKDNKVHSSEEAAWQGSRDRDTKPRSTVARSAQRSTRAEITLHQRRRLPLPRRAARPRRARLLHWLCIRASWADAGAQRTAFVTRRRALSRDLEAEMLLIMRPDKLALCRVLSITRRIFHERSAQRNRYMPPRLSSSLGDALFLLFPWM